MATEWTNYTGPGYHGTTSTRAATIVTQQRFVVHKGAKSHYGPGVYFYIDAQNATGVDFALGYCMLKERENPEYCNPVVLGADLECDNCVDLVLHQEAFRSKMMVVRREAEEADTNLKPWQVKRAAAMLLKQDWPEINAFKYVNDYRGIEPCPQSGIVINVLDDEKRSEMIKNIRTVYPNRN